jgi:hypothetical protein
MRRLRLDMARLLKQHPPKPALLRSTYIPEIDAELSRLIGLMVRGTITQKEREFYEELSQHRVDLMMPKRLREINRLKRLHR